MDDAVIQQREAGLSDDERTSEAGSNSLSVLVAKYVMGWTLVRSTQLGKYNGTRYWEGAPYGHGSMVGWHWNPAEQIEQAFMAVEAMRAKGWVCETFSNDSANPDGHSATFWRHDVAGSFTVRGPLSSAICEAAITALEAPPPASRS